MTGFGIYYYTLPGSVVFGNRDRGHIEYGSVAEPIDDIVHNTIMQTNFAG